MTLNQTWSKCLKMWRWVVEQRKNGSNKGIDELKEIWLETNDPGVRLSCDCYFCEYARNQCSSCPGRGVAPRFDCMDSAYNFFLKPKKFLAKLERLDKKRRSSK